MRFDVPLAGLATLVLAACDPGNLPLPIDAGVDSATLDGGSEADGGPLDAGPSPPDAQATDASSDDAGAADGGGIVRDSVPAPPAEILRTGTGGFLLRGAAVLAPSGPIVPGEVLIVGTTIRCVAADCSSDPMAATVTVIDTHATISPGLIDGHNHLTYDFLPEWVPDPVRTFVSRYEWRDDPDYSAFTRPEGDSDPTVMGNQRGSECPGAKWGELRSIIHGTTTVQGQLPTGMPDCLNRLARNADHRHGLGADTMRTTIAGPCEPTFPARSGLITDFGNGDATRLVVHVAEGVAPHGMPGSASDPTREFDCYAGRTGPTPGLIFDSTGAPYETGVMIHAIPLTDAELDEAAMGNVRFVWSPSSNILLYGQTADIGAMLERDLVIGLGPDWTPADSDEMLSEMRFAQDYGRAMSVSALTAQRIWQMATFDGADVVGQAASIGSLAVGYRADISVFGRVAADPYQAVLDSRAVDVRLVMIDGAGYYGDSALEDATAINGECEVLDACGTPKYLCVANTPGGTTGATETMDDIEAQLTTILGRYGRASELLPLVDCTL